MPTVKELASEMSAAFTGGERNDGTKFRKLRDESPQWMTDVCRKGHGDMFPDDWRYVFIEDAVDALANQDDGDDADEARDSLEASVYTSDLTAWLHSRVDRTFWMDEATRELGPFDNIFNHLMAAQHMEMEETFGLVLKALRELASEDDDAEEETLEEVD